MSGLIRVLGGLRSLIGRSGKNPAKTVPRSVGLWFGGCAGMCFGAVVLGGITRLTESGLSMTDWRLLGSFPPLGEEAWKKEFSKYMKSPEYIHLKKDISLPEFKKIWYMEYGHRMWGRLIGAFYFLPACAFWFRGYFDNVLKKRVALGGIILGCQGLLGWYMVKSGLDHKNFDGPSDIPRVSQYRLASHLGTAMVLYSLLFWNSISILYTPTMPKPGSSIPYSLLQFRKMVLLCKGLVFLTSISGAFVAGLDAGLVYNSFPLMGHSLFPDDYFAYSPLLKNVTENPSAVQFNHRTLGVVTLFAVTITALSSLKIPMPLKVRKATFTLMTMGWLQVTLGISTLVTLVPTALAAAHQTGALLTLSSALWLMHEVKHIKILKHLPK